MMASGFVCSSVSYWGVGAILTAMCLKTGSVKRWRGDVDVGLACCRPLWLPES